MTTQSQTSPQLVASADLGAKIVALAGIGLIGYGILFLIWNFTSFAVVALAWFGIRTGQKWALWTAFIAPVIALLIGLPLHYVYGLDTLGHLGPIYLDVVILMVGTVMSYNALKA